MIKLNHVNKYFNKRKSNEIRAIDDTSIVLPDKGLVTFLGNSGCGKTTLLNAIGGLDDVDSGEIEIDDRIMPRKASGTRDEIRNINIGYIFQNYNLIEDATVFANVALALRMTGFTGKEAIEERVMYILERVGIARYRNRPVNMLSGGERQRVGIARAIVKNPRIIIADEPTGNLDSTNTIEVMNIIKAISRDKLVILVTHERKIAEFYADRIIEIVDGRIVDDRENSHAGSLDYRVDNRIYLKDMVNREYQISGEKGTINLFTDSAKDIPPIKIIIRNNHLYIDTDGRLEMGQGEVEMIDGHYEGLSRDVMDKYEFNYENVYKGIDEKYNKKGSQRGVPSTPKYRTIYGPLTSLKRGFQKIASYSKLKKILLLGFLFASMFVIYAVSSVAGAKEIRDSDFLTTNRDYLRANVGVLSRSIYERYEEDPSVDYVIPGTGEVSFAISLDDYMQTVWETELFAGVVTDVGTISEDSLIAGRLPQASNEIVLDAVVVNRLMSSPFIKEVGMESQEDLIGRSAYVSHHIPELKIVGICDTNQPCVYVAREMIVPLAIHDMGMYASEAANSPYISVEGEINPYSTVDKYPEITLVSGTMPKNDYEILLPDVLMENKQVGEIMDQRINGNNLAITGFYHDERGGMAYYANEKTVLLSKLMKYDVLTIAPKNKVETLADLQDGKIDVVDVYQQEKEEFEVNRQQSIIKIEITAAVIILISLIEIYLILRASFLSRIKEVGVLRAVGLKRGDIYRMFSGEVLAITILTAIPGMLGMAYLLSIVSRFMNSYKMTPGIFILSLAIVFCFNLLGGLLPVYGTLKKTPAEILARNDVA